MNQRMYQIGEVAEAVGLSLRTIRYYEEANVVPPSGRSTGGFRLYTDADIERLRLVRNMKPLDISLDEMRDLMAVRDSVADASLPWTDRERMIERLAMYAALAIERCDRLREQLQNAETISVMLNREIVGARSAHET